MTDYLQIANNIRTIRESKGFTQLYIARKLKISQQAYSIVEKAPENATLGRLTTIAKLLDVELITLLNLENTYVQHNFNQAGGNAATKMINNYSNNERDELFERMIAQLKEEIAYLRATTLKK